MIKVLVKAGANTELRTPMGLDVVHLAAQGDYPQLLAFFNEMSLNMESTDSRGLTPLHWASYMGAYHAALVLCSCRVSRNAQDQEGHTPLHLAVVGNNLRVVKLLIIKGCIKDAKDGKGRTPMDLAVTNKYDNLIDSLKTHTFLEILGFKPNITPFATSLWPFIILVCALVATFIVIGIFCATCKFYLDNRYASYIFAFTSTCVVCLMVYIVNSDPGFIPKDYKCKLTVKFKQELYDSNKPGEICPDCKIVKVHRSRHCHQCHRCVKKFDHHCQWMNNCIGAKNLGAFYCFIFLLWLNIIIGVWLCISVFASKKGDNDGDDIPLAGSQSIAAICLIVELIMFLPVSYLLWTHSNNFVLGLTTNERQSAMKTEKGGGNCASNWASMCCNIENNDDERFRRFSSMGANPLEVSLQEANK